MRDMDLKIAEAIAGMIPEEPEESPAESEVVEEPTREVETKSVRRTKK